MNIVIDKKNGIPIYIQIKNQIMEEIKNGNLKIGDKMPTERELAKAINTSRNTVSAAYNLLEQEGVLTSYQGRGTFVAEEAKTWKQHDIKDKLLKIIDIALEEALEMGIDSREFFAIIQERIKEREEFIKKINAVFIECNIEQAKDFSKQLSEAIDFNVIPMTISELNNMTDKTKKILEQTQLIITTFNHVNEVKNLTLDFNKDVFGVAINPSLETIVKIARYPKETKFGLVCLSKEFHFKVENALKSAGLDNIIINATTSRRIEDVQYIIDTCDVLIVSPGRKSEVLKLSKEEKEVIRFDYNLDQDSVKAVIVKIMEIKKNI
ncbi:transcriptional regulator, GntR family [Caloramator quimbayensis]|uniref:Transcriptional regulator, GntR family n=1 Tax=Caloramator quimbayensis TaxID=1147123 RepID=A0A1T4XL08_9CLOT|nr:GntR family transcriptional regulator [Caloramator quimbayensis]SKA90242.1 transcriptional regulator, GntR family [Caloramator quimbayensis]